MYCTLNITLTVIKSSYSAAFRMKAQMPVLSVSSKYVRTLELTQFNIFSLRGINRNSSLKSVKQ